MNSLKRLLKLLWSVVGPGETLGNHIQADYLIYLPDSATIPYREDDLTDWLTLRVEPIKWLGYAGDYYGERDYDAELRGETAGWEGVDFTKIQFYALLGFYENGKAEQRCLVYYAPYNNKYVLIFTKTERGDDGFFHGTGKQFWANKIPI